MNWRKVMNETLFWYTNKVNDNTISLASFFIDQVTSGNRGMVPHEMTKSEGNLTPSLIKWMDVTVLGSLFVAAKINECRDSNPINMRHLTLYSLSNTDVIGFERKLLKLINWNVPLVSIQHKSKQSK